MNSPSFAFCCILGSDRAKNTVHRPSTRDIVRTYYMKKFWGKLWVILISNFQAGLRVSDLPLLPAGIPVFIKMKLLLIKFESPRISERC
jgi:hypothetical protein